MFRVSSQTFCPFLNGVNVFFFLSAIQLLASSCAASASSQSVIIHLIFLSIDGNFVFSKTSGIAFGDSPIISSNGVLGQLACLLLLCVNSNVDIDLFHVSG